MSSPYAFEPNDPFTVHIGDARDTAEFLASFARRELGSDEPFITATITSPPYANLVDYGVENQIGFKQDYPSYLAECRKIFESVAQWTKEDGSLWLVADTLTLPSGTDGMTALTPLPFDLASVAREAGWTLKEVVIWRKDKTRPWAARGRLRNGFEYVLLFARTSKYKFNASRLRDHRSLKSWWVKYPERHNPWGMTPDNVWEIPIPLQGSWASDDLRHACPFPVELVRRMVELSTDPGDIVFDPFSGSGMVAAVASTNERLAFGTELNPEFVEAFKSRILPEVRAELAEPLDIQSSAIMTANLLKLRVLKYPKELLKQVLRQGIERQLLVGAVVTVDDFAASSGPPPYATVRVRVVVGRDTTDFETKKISDAVRLATSRAPLSKYSITAEVTVDDAEISAESTLTIYRHGRTWRSAGTFDPASDISLYADDDFPVILSNTSIDIRLEE